MTDKGEFDMIKRAQTGNPKETDYIIIGANELEGRKKTKYVRRNEWDGDLEKLKDV
jgi:hypothetical protein